MQTEQPSGCSSLRENGKPPIQPPESDGRQIKSEDVNGCLIPARNVPAFVQALPGFSARRVRGLMTLALFSSEAERVRQCAQCSQ